MTTPEDMQTIEEFPTSKKEFQQSAFQEIFEHNASKMLGSFGKEPLMYGDDIKEIEEIKNAICMAVDKRFITPIDAYLYWQKIYEFFLPRQKDHIQKDIRHNTKGAILAILTLISGVGKTEKESMEVLHKCDKLVDCKTLPEAHETCYNCGQLRKDVFRRERGEEPKCPIFVSPVQFFDVIEIPPPNIFESRRRFYMWDVNWADIKKDELLKKIHDFVSSLNKPPYTRYQQTKEREILLAGTMCKQELNELKELITDLNLATFNAMKYGQFIPKMEVSWL